MKLSPTPVFPSINDDESYKFFDTFKTNSKRKLHQELESNPLYSSHSIPSNSNSSISL